MPLIDLDLIDDTTVDALTISDWLANRQHGALLPRSADQTRLEWAHENTAAWDRVVLPAGLTLEQARALMVAAVPA